LHRRRTAVSRYIRKGRIAQKPNRDGRHRNTLNEKEKPVIRKRKRNISSGIQKKEPAKAIKPKPAATRKGYEVKPSRKSTERGRNHSSPSEKTISGCSNQESCIQPR